ncbi:MAG: hypothetical protein ACAH07_06065 [Methylophilaceae bacterium]|nr:hypothetical protein [Methyloradius sp.]
MRSEIYLMTLFIFCVVLLLAALVRQANRMGPTTHPMIKLAAVLLAFGSAVKLIAALHQVLSPTDLFLSSITALGISMWIYFDRRTQ